MIVRNPRIANIKAGYLFPEIARRRRAYQSAHPEAKIISLGVGNTTEPILPHIDAGLLEGARRLGSAATYSGYQDEGLLELREKIVAVFYSKAAAASVAGAPDAGRAAGTDADAGHQAGPAPKPEGRDTGPIAAPAGRAAGLAVAPAPAFGPDEIFISDGAKCDIGRLQLLFGAGTPVAVQDPSYPVYVDGSVLIGAAGAWTGAGYAGITYLPCTADNGYFPDLDRIPENGLLYFCSPNNPTGATATRAQLAALVAAARQKGFLIIFDAAYAEYIRDPALPKSIFEIPGARECAIEVNSFSKPAGFTGVRLGWTVVPKELRYASGESVNADWSRVTGTIFNGASNIAQYGALAALDPEGIREMRELCDFYLGNARLIREALATLGYASTGGDNSPYIWAEFPGRDSWDVFAEILDRCQVVTTPGSGFGPAGEGFVRFSAFGHRADVEEACARLIAGMPGAADRARP